MYEIIVITAKQAMLAGYTGLKGGALRGTHYALYEVGKGFCSLDGGRTTFMMDGRNGLKSIENIIKMGGFVGEVAYRKTI